MVSFRLCQAESSWGKCLIALNNFVTFLLNSSHAICTYQNSLSTSLSVFPSFYVSAPLLSFALPFSLPFFNLLPLSQSLSFSLSSPLSLSISLFICYTLIPRLWYPPGVLLDTQALLRLLHTVCDTRRTLLEVDGLPSPGLLCRQDGDLHPTQRWNHHHFRLSTSVRGKF